MLGSNPATEKVENVGLRIFYPTGQKFISQTIFGLAPQTLAKKALVEKMGLRFEDRVTRAGSKGMTIILRQLKVGTFQNFAYIIGDDESKLAAIVDPAWEVGRILDELKALGLRPKYVINTHSHHDHIEGNDEAVSKTGAQVVMHKSAKLRKDLDVEDGDTLKLGALTLSFIHTPGHCPDHICVIVDGKVLTGDTLFVGECGRTDLSGGDAGLLYESLFGKLLKLSDNTEVYPGHDYGKAPSSTIGNERRTNYTLARRSKDDFVKFMAEP